MLGALTIAAEEAASLPPLARSPGPARPGLRRAAGPARAGPALVGMSCGTGAPQAQLNRPPTRQDSRGGGSAPRADAAMSLGGLGALGGSKEPTRRHAKRSRRTGWAGNF